MSTTTPHPVDSTFYHCCQAIGQHSPDCTAELVGTPAHDNGINATSTEGATTMTTTSPNVPIPAGAVSAQARQIGEGLLAAADELDAIEAVAK